MAEQSGAAMPCGRAQRLGEEIANAVSHGLAALAAMFGTGALLLRALRNQADGMTLVSAALYGASMILLYLNSCLYHALALPRGKRVFQVLDHCAIFLLILGTYIPIALVGLGGVLGYLVFGLVSACALVGIILNAVNLQRFKRASLALYIVMGWMAVFTLRPIWQSIGPGGTALLLLGGVFYTVGVLFYKQKERPYMHFVWHLFVAAGSVMHYWMIYSYII